MAGTQPKRVKVVTDTCTALRLAATNLKIYKATTLSTGNLVICHGILREIGRFSTDKKRKYQKEIGLLNLLIPAPETNVPHETYMVYKKAISSIANIIGQPLHEG